MLIILNFVVLKRVKILLMTFFVIAFGLMMEKVRLIVIFIFVNCFVVVCISVRDGADYNE